MCNKALEDVHAQTTKNSVINEDELHRQAIVIAKEARLKNLREIEARMRAHGGLEIPLYLSLFYFEEILCFVRLLFLTHE